MGSSLVATGLFFSACDEPDPVESVCDGSFASVQRYVFEPACAGVGCHSGDDPAAVLDLTAADTEKSLVTVSAGTCEDQTLVVPGQLDASFLWQKVHSASPLCGEPMPMARGLSAAELTCLKRWIESVDESAGPGPGCETCGGDQCVDLSRDPSHCGSCDTRCPAGSECVQGACSCAGGLATCGDTCVDTMADHGNCGGCEKPCPSGALCNVGECVCGGGLSACGESCVDTTSDSAHCGGCDAPCAAGEVCLRGSCSTGCADLTQCGGSCVDTQSSSQNCGNCEVACPAGASCLSGGCVCPLGTSDCGGQCLNTLSDALNCGGCGQACPAGLSCADGACACPGGGTACASGCTDTQVDPNNCGGCGTVCGAGQSCVGGVCSCGQAGAVSFGADIAPILDAGCASRGCHDRTAKANLELTASVAFAQLVGTPASQCPERSRVVAGDPSQSYVMQKLLGQNLCQGSQMPKAGQSLPQADLDAIGAWICQGAQNN